MSKVEFLSFDEFRFKLEMYVRRYKCSSIKVYIDTKFDRVVSALSYDGTIVEQFYWWGDVSRIPREYCRNIRISINDILKDKVIEKTSIKNLSELHQFNLFECGLDV